MPTELEILQGIAINHFLEKSHLPAFQDSKFFINGKPTTCFEKLWDDDRKLSHGERIVLHVAKDIWSWDERVIMMDLLNLSDYLINLSFSIYLALKQGEQGLIEWINKN